MSPLANTRLLAERANRGLTIPEAAAQIGVARGTLDRAEKGEALHPGSRKMIADFYGLKVTDIWPVEELAA